MDDLDITRVHPRNPLDDLIGDLKRRKPAPVPFARHLEHYPAGWREPTWWEEVGLAAHNTIKAAKTTTRFVSLLVTLIYHIYNGNNMAIIRSIVAILMAILANVAPGVADIQIAGYGLNEILTWGFLIVAGWFLPQLRHLSPAIIRQIFQWNTVEKDNGNGK